jgi:hypothetical protein
MMMPQRSRSHLRRAAASASSAASADFSKNAVDGAVSRSEQATAIRRAPADGSRAQVSAAIYLPIYRAPTLYSLEILRAPGDARSGRLLLTPLGYAEQPRLTGP